jgi:hypothetical protein
MKTYTALPWHGGQKAYVRLSRRVDLGTSLEEALSQRAALQELKAAYGALDWGDRGAVNRLLEATMDNVDRLVQEAINSFIRPACQAGMGGPCYEQGPCGQAPCCSQEDPCDEKPGPECQADEGDGCGTGQTCGGLMPRAERMQLLALKRILDNLLID